MALFFYIGINTLNTTLLEHRSLNSKNIYFNELAYEDDNYILCFSGDIYSDETPTFAQICELYEESGESFLANLDGDFSIVLYDKRKDITLAAVDKFGMKSLYYYKDASYIAFSNRILSIYQYLDVVKEPNLRKNLLYVGSHYRHIDTPEEETFYKNIYAIKHHHCLNLHDNIFKLNSYWELKLIDLSGKTEKELQSEYLNLLRQSIKRRLNSSKNPAFMVSSGMDSSGVAALSSEILHKKVTFFTTVFTEETEYNEADDIIPLANKIADTWHQLTIDPNIVVDTVLEVLQEADEPFYTVTQLMHYFLSKEVAKLGHDTLFGGLGGDEANCGEIEEYLFYFADLQSRGEKEKLKEDIDGWIQYHGTPEYPKSEGVVHEYFDKHINFEKAGKNILDLARYNKYMNIFNSKFYEENYIVPKLAHPYNSYLRNKLHQDLFSEAIPCVLKAEEFSLSKFGIKARMPYFNADVMQYGFSIPIKYKYKNGCNKALLREAMRGILPDETVENCIKKGWNAPFGEWIKVFLKNKVESILSSPTKRQAQIYNLAQIQDLLNEHLSGEINHMMFFWQFLNYELWYGIHFDS